MLWYLIKSELSSRGELCKKEAPWKGQSVQSSSKGNGEQELVSVCQVLPFPALPHTPFPFTPIP